MQRSSIVLMFRIGMFVVGIAMVMFGIMYWYFISAETPIDVRQFLVRLILFYLFVAIDLWLAVLLRWGRNL